MFQNEILFYLQKKIFKNSFLDKLNMFQKFQISIFYFYQNRPNVIMLDISVIYIYNIKNSGMLLNSKWLI